MLFIIGITLRFLPYESTFEAARVVLALNFVTYFLRLLHIFSVHKKLGPKLVMIGKMLKDLIYFLLILMVFVLSYAIASHSILYPNAPLTWKTAVQIIREADCSYDATIWINGTQARCPTDTGKWLVPIMMGIYILLANVLLLNLLIAMFSNTFEKVQDNADKHWFFQRFSLIHEYYTRPVLFPPLILLAHIFLVFRFVCESCCRGAMKKEREETKQFLLAKMKIQKHVLESDILKLFSLRAGENVSLPSVHCELVKDQPTRIISILCKTRCRDDRSKLSNPLHFSHLYFKTDFERLGEIAFYKMLNKHLRIWTDYYS
ncbi:TMP2L-like protein [Mya arenaria]|uniref:TMP2L-like protein n=1 Tax=Mya arenaria TaxID=6604 RepID=A0ABY7E9M3_MYAAR|nr:TMP2L-like protein [Mya arenaria]